MSGWYETCTQTVTKDAAIRIAARAKSGDANLSSTPEDWARKKVEEGMDFKILVSEDHQLSFDFIPE